MEKLMTIGEVSRYLRVSERTLFRYIKSKKLKAYRIGQWRVSESNLKQFLRKMSNV
ncbi:MAG: helix-turn-helix domain-containing protein [Patescibacteria group bacterium]|jgi:excisionase family DNA binding protein